jgi:hypothetical protein
MRSETTFAGSGILLADPPIEKTRIERTKGGLLIDSFHWILNNPGFQRWREGNHNQLLWIKGDAGKGKTMLMIGIINELQQQVARSGQSSVTEVLSYFLCQATDPRLNTATAILRGMIYLLASEQHTCGKSMTALAKSCSRVVVHSTTYPMSSDRWSRIRSCSR